MITISYLNHVCSRVYNGLAMGFGAAALLPKLCVPTTAAAHRRCCGELYKTQRSCGLFTYSHILTMPHDAASTAGPHGRFKAAAMYRKALLRNQAYWGGNHPYRDLKITLRHSHPLFSMCTGLC